MPAYGCSEPGKEIFAYREFHIENICRSFAIPVGLLPRSRLIASETVHFRAQAYSLYEAQVIAECYRVMLPELKVRTLETEYLTTFEVQAYESYRAA